VIGVPRLNVKCFGGVVERIRLVVMDWWEGLWQFTLLYTPDSLEPSRRGDLSKGVNSEIHGTWKNYFEIYWIFLK